MVTGTSDQWQGRRWTRRWKEQWGGRGRQESRGARREGAGDAGCGEGGPPGPRRLVFARDAYGPRVSSQPDCARAQNTERAMALFMCLWSKEAAPVPSQGRLQAGRFWSEQAPRAQSEAPSAAPPLPRRRVPVAQSPLQRQPPRPGWAEGAS